MMYVRLLLSLPNVEDRLHERGADICHETERAWWMRFGPPFARNIRRKRGDQMRQAIQWRWHLDEVFVTVRGKTRPLWRAVDHEGEVLERDLTKSRDRQAALRFFRKAMKRYGRPKKVVTDKLGSYRAVLRGSGAVGFQETGPWLNNRAENSHQPFRR